MTKQPQKANKPSQLLTKATLVIAKITEICGWCATVAMIILLIAAIRTANGALAGFAIPSIILCILMAMIFRNVYLIVKTTAGKTWFAKGKTPFQNDVVRMVREIGIFLISSTVIRLIASVVLRLLFPETEFSASAIEFVLGLLMLCLSQSFTYGEKLEKEVSGLI